MDHVKTHGHEREGRKVRGSFLSLGIRPTKWEKKKTIMWDENKKGGKKIKRKKRVKKEKEKGKEEKKWDEENQALGGGGGGSHTVGERKKEKGEREREDFSRCSDGQSSIVQELKLVHTTRAMRGYQNLNFSSKL